jgi:hypothetical protein
MSETTHGMPEADGNGARPVGEQPLTPKHELDAERRQSVRPGDRERPHTSHHPERQPRPTPRRGESQLPHTFGKVSLEDILALNLISGMRIGWGYDQSPFATMRGPLGALFSALSPASTMFGLNVITLHVWSAFFMLLVTGVYVGYLFRSGTARKLRVTRSDLRKLGVGLRSGHFWRHKPALWSANLLVYWVAFLFIGVLTLTGVVLYRLDLGLSGALGGYDVVRLMHTVVGYLLIPYTVLHAVLQWFFGRFWTIFKTQIWGRHVLAGVLGLLIAAPLAVAAYYVDAVPETLTVSRITGPAPPAVHDHRDVSPNAGPAQRAHQADQNRRAAVGRSVAP